jgi:MFS superfamily sulfate permease-like transporter
MKGLDSLKKDFSAGFSVALVALPLSIGIALASGAPASAGLITAIIGGLIGSWLGGAALVINGPAAGLIVIVLDAITSLGFQGMLGAAVVAALLQITFGLLKLGRKGALFPVSVIHGMMAAIGIIIFAKQAHILLGHIPQAKNPILLLGELPFAFSNFKPLVAIIGGFTLLLLIFWTKINQPLLKKIPGPLLGVIFGGVLAKILNLDEASFLKVPAEISNWFFSPDFSVMTTATGWISAITLALVGSLETVLSASAVDKLDPEKRKSNLDRDLTSKGVCNLFTALVGGLPMIAEIVRSSANISYGAKTWKSNFFHGLVILVAVLLIPNALNLIPLAALASILVMIGWRLGNPKHMQHAIQVGKDNVVGFMVTLVLTLAVDLLVGIFCGVIAQFATELYLGLKLKNSFKTDYEKKTKGNSLEFKVKSSLVFCNFLTVREDILSAIQAKNSLVIDLSDCDYIDHSVMEQLQELESHALSKGLTFKKEISPLHRSLGTSSLSAKRKTAFV